MRCLSVTCLIRTHVSANLNGSYFTNRQDRYLHFKSTSLSDYCLSFLQSVVPFCFQMRPGNQESYDLSWPDKITSHEQIERKAEKALRGFQKRHLGNTLGETTNPNGNVLIFPIIQAGQFNIREEERSIDLLFKHLNQYTYSTGNAPLVDLTSGYFSLSESYQKLIRDSPADCQILCASPKVWHAPLYLISTSHINHVGKWFLRVFWTIRSYTRRIHTSRATLLAWHYQPLSPLVSILETWCPTTRMGTHRMDVSCKGHLGLTVANGRPGSHSLRLYELEFEVSEP